MASPAQIYTYTSCCTSILSATCMLSISVFYSSMEKLILFIRLCVSHTLQSFRTARKSTNGPLYCVTVLSHTHDLFYRHLLQRAFSVSCPSGHHFDIIDSMEPCIPASYRLIELFVGVITITANVVLLFLIFCRTPTKLKDYSKALLCNAVIDIIYTAIATVTQPVSIDSRIYGEHQSMICCPFSTSL